MTEPSNKRQKTQVGHADQSLLLVDLPSIWISFCNFSSLNALRATSRVLKTKVDDEVDKREQDILRNNQLPLTYETNSRDCEHAKRVTLKLGWSEEYTNRDQLIAKALTWADPGGQVSLGADYDEERAERLIRLRGWVSVGAFLDDSSENDDDSRDSDDDPGVDEIGWTVQFKHWLSVRNRSKAWDIAAEAWDIDDYEADCTNDVSAATRLRETLLILLRKAQPSSFRLSYAECSYEHTDYPAGGKHSALMFRSSDNRQVELIVEYDWEST